MIVFFIQVTYSTLAVCTSLMIDQYIQLMWGGMGNLNAVTKYLATCIYALFYCVSFICFKTQASKPIEKYLVNDIGSSKV